MLNIKAKSKEQRAKSDAIVYQAKSKEQNNPNFKYFVSRIFTSELRRLSLKRDRKAKSNEVDLHGKTLVKL